MSGKFLTRWMIAAIAAMFVLPFAWPRHTLPIPSFYGEWIAAILLLLACLPAILHFFVADDRGHGVSAPSIAILFLPLIGILLLQVCNGTLYGAEEIVLPVLTMIAATAAIVLGATATRLIGMDHLLFWICIVCILGGLFNVLAQLLQFFGTGDYVLLWISRSSGSLYGNLAQRNHLATYLGWGLVAVFYLYGKRHVRAQTALALTCGLLVGVTLTASRMTWLQIGCIAVFGSYLLWKMPVQNRPQYWRWLLCVPLLYLLMTLILPSVLHVLDFRSLNETALDRLRSQVFDGNRWLIYRQAWDTFIAHPLLGVGPDRLSFNQFLLMDRYDHVLFASSAHNVILDLLVMSGVVGLACVSWILFGWFLRVRKISLSLESICMALMLSVFGIHALLEYPEWYGFFLFPAAFLLGALDPRVICIGKTRLVPSLATAAVVCGLACCAVLYSQYVTLEKLYANRYYYNAKASPADGNQLADLKNYYDVTFFKGPAAFILAWNMRLNDDDLANKLALSERAIRYQQQANTVYRHIVWLQLSGQQEQALSYLLRLKKTYPDDFANIQSALIDLGNTQPQAFGSLISEARGSGLIESD